MIVICGLTPSELGITLPSATYSPSHTVHPQVGVEHPARGVGVGASGSKGVEGQQFQIAGAGPLGGHAGGQRQVDLAGAGRTEELLEAGEARAELGDVVLDEVVADQQPVHPVPPRGRRTLPRELSLTISPNCARWR